MSSHPKDDPNLIQFVVDLFYKQAIDPSSQQFLPKLIQGQTNPTYEPYYYTEPFNPVALTDLSAASAVCSTQGGATDNYIVTPDTTPSLSLSNLHITGISNALPDPATVTNDTIAITAALSTYPSSVAPAPLTISGDFSLTQYCCETTDFSTCAAPSGPFVGTGTFAVSIKNSTAKASVLVGVNADDQLVATVQSLHWLASHSASNITATVDILSIPEDADRDTWNSYTEEALNSEMARQKLVVSVQQMMGESATLASLSALITTGLQSLTGEALEALSAARDAD
jgi:hypothetical protein